MIDPRFFDRSFQYSLFLNTHRTAQHHSTMGVSSTMLEDKTDLGWDNVALGLTFIAFDAGLSFVFGLGIGTSLLSAALRCVVQLTVVATILQKVFATESFWAVAGISGERTVRPCC